MIIYDVVPVDTLSTETVSRTIADAFLTSTTSMSLTTELVTYEHATVSRVVVYQHVPDNARETITFDLPGMPFTTGRLTATFPLGSIFHGDPTTVEIVVEMTTSSSSTTTPMASPNTREGR